jgi:hypothetical protein
MPIRKACRPNSSEALYSFFFGLSLTDRSFSSVDYGFGTMGVFCFNPNRNELQPGLQTVRSKKGFVFLKTNQKRPAQMGEGELDLYFLALSGFSKS